MKANIKTITVIATIALLTLLISNSSFSQEAETEKKDEEVRGYFMFGGSKLDIDALNNRLVSKDYSSFSDNFFSLGGGFLREKNNNWLFGAEGHFLLVEEKDKTMPNGSHKASLTAAYGFFDVGHILVSSGGLNIYPLIGFGVGGTSLKIGKNNFDDILNDPERNAELSTFIFLLNFALGTDYLLKSKDDKEGVGMVLGFRVGYTYAPWKGGWWTDVIGIDGGPKTGITGPYIRFMIGVGGKGEWWKEQKNNVEKK